MEFKGYCRNVELELMPRESKLYDVIRKMDQTSTRDKKKAMTWQGRCLSNFLGIRPILQEKQSHLLQARS